MMTVAEIKRLPTAEVAQKKADLAYCDQVIARTKEAWRECGIMLARIEDEDLWMFALPPKGQEPYKNANNYIRRVHGISRSQAHRMANSAVVASMLDPAGEMFKNETEVRDFVNKEKADNPQAPPTAAKKRKQLEDMTADELVEERNETQKKLLDPARNQRKALIEKVEHAVRQARGIAKLFSEQRCAEGVGIMERVEMLLTEMMST